MYRKRLKNVYELLEAGNNKKVIQEVDKLIATSSSSGAGKKKIALPSDNVYDEQATLVIGKALKCLALVRTNRKPEADALIDELLDCKTADENALAIIMQYCKETQQLSKIVTFYENAVNECQQNPAAMMGTPEHEELQSTLFYAYVRNCDFAKQQQIALKLYKQTNRMMYCYWNAASYVMMSKAGSNFIQNGTGSGVPPPPTAQQSMYLQLAEKMLQKAYEEQKMEYNGEFLLYLSILEERNKVEEALKIVEAFNEEQNLSKLGITDFKVKKRLEYLRKLKRWPELSEQAEQYLGLASSANLDNWLVYLDYIDSIFARLEAKQVSADQLTGLLTSESIAPALKFLDELKDRIETNSAAKAQGPYLARIELLSRLMQFQKKISADFSDAGLVAKLKQLFEDYIDMFASKPGIFYDLIYFKQLYKTTRELKSTVLACLKKHHDSQRPFKDVKSVYTCLAYWQMSRYLGEQSKLDKKQLESLVDEMEKMYVEALAFGKDMLPTSFQYADDFIALACHLRYDIYRKFNRQEPASNDLFQIIYNLKHALTHSPSNYQLKLLLLNLYSHIGAYDALHQMYHSMEIKNIQNYSTSNLLLVHNIRLGALSTASFTYNMMDQFFNSNQFDMVNFLVNCYKYGTFMKAFEICSFMNTIKHSLSVNLCLTNHMSLGFIFHSTNLTATLGSSGGHELVHAGNTGQSDEEAIALDFKQLQSKLEKHMKEVANVSSAFDPKTGLLPDDDAKLAETLLDHHDKDVVAQWDTDEDEALAKRQYESVIDEQRQLLRMRSLMVRFTDAILKEWLASDETTQDAKPGSEEDRSKLELYKQKLVNLDIGTVANGSTSQNGSANRDRIELTSIYVTQSSYLRRIGELKLNTIVKTIVHLAGELCQNDNFLQSEQDNGQKTLTHARSTLQECYEAIKSKLQTILADFDKTKSPKHGAETIATLLEYYTSSLEVLSFVVNTFAVCVSSKSLKQIWSEKTKKIKKKKGLYVQYAQSVDVLFEIYELLCSVLRHYYADLKQTICSNVAALSQAQLEGVRQVLTAASAPNSSTFLEDIVQSHVKSFEDLKQLYGAKLRYLLKFSGSTSNLGPNLASILEILKI